MKLTLRQLRYFSQIVEAGNLTRAAKSLNLAPTALSLQVREMEDRLGVKLLDRHSRGVRPTDRGTMLYERSLQILAMVRETESEISGRDIDRRVIDIGILPSMVRLLGFHALHVASGRAPSIDLRFSEISSLSQVTQLRAGELNFAIVRDLEPAPEFRWIDVLMERLVYVTAPSKARSSGLFSLQEVLSSELAFYREGDSFWRRVHTAASAAHLTVLSTQIVGSIFMLRQMVSDGETSAIVPFGLVHGDAGLGRIAVHEIADHPIWQRISLVWSADKEAKLPVVEVRESIGGLATELKGCGEGRLRAPRSE